MKYNKITKRIGGKLVTLKSMGDNSNWQPVTRNRVGKGLYSQPHGGTITPSVALAKALAPVRQISPEQQRINNLKSLAQSFRL